MTTTVRFEGLTPNLLVADVMASVAFYRDVFGFEVHLKVPDEPPYVFASLKRDGIEFFVNAAAGVVKEFPTLRTGHTSTLFIIVDQVDALFASIKDRAPIAMPLKDQFYGMREFAVFDPDGYLVTFAQPIRT
jgi:lactoylglutathione lyase